MKTLIAIIGAAALFGGVQVFQDKEQGGTALKETAPVAGSYRLTANGDSAACTIRRGAGLSGGLSQLTVGPDCGAVLPGLERAKFWRDRKDGTVALSENGADPIVSFAAGDGVDYESYAPALPLLSLAAVE
jgi:hypothetical protein